MTRPQPVRRERIGRPLKDHDPKTTPLAPRFEEYLWAKRRSINETTRKDYQYVKGMRRDLDACCKVAFRA